MRRLSLLLLSLFMAVVPSLAQGIIRGIVANSAGAPQADVTVVFRGESKPPVTSITNKRGLYTSPRLSPGTYTVSFFAAGYETLRFTGVPIKTGAEIIVNAGMEKAGAWGRSTVTRGYVPSPPMVKVPRRKNKYHLTGIYPSGIVTMGMTHTGSPEPVTERETPGGRAIRIAETIDKSASRNAGDIASLSMQAYPSSPGIAAPEARAGSLTSGEINDFSKWTLWQDMSMDELKSYQSAWPFRPEFRYTVLVKSKEGAPLCNAHVALAEGGIRRWEAVTDNTGKAELWFGMMNAGKVNPGSLSAAVNYGGQQFSIPKLMPSADGTNILSTNLSCHNPAKLDIVFIVDATGSMQDEIDYLKAELRDILQKVKDSMPATQVQTGAVFYRDLSDAYITRSSDLTPDFSRTEAFIADNNANGGGDFPEALDAALEEGLNTLHWRADATARLAFLVLDAPPHNDASTIKRMQTLTAQYAARGIRLIPVVCSGSDKSNEYLMRAMALATNGTYLFLTDHSGIGGSHTSPATDKYDVEYLNGLIYRVIYQCTYMPACKPALSQQRDTMLVSDPTSDSTKIIGWRYFPNPTTGILHIEHTYTTGYMLISDITGKAILRVPVDASGRTTIDIGQYPAGLYAIRYNIENDRWVSSKFVLVH